MSAIAPSEAGDIVFYTVDAIKGGLQAVNPKSLLEQRAARVWETYNGQDLPAGTVVDEITIFTLEDRPIMKERITELLEKRLVAKEFVKEVKLITVRNLPKYSEILSTNMSILTTEVLASNPFLGERDLLSTTGTIPQNAQKTDQRQARKNSENKGTFLPITSRERSDSAISPETSKVSKPSNISEPSSKQNPRNVEKDYQKCGNPFRAFIKVRKPSGDSNSIKSPVSPKNPFKSFVRAKTPPPSPKQAIVPVNGNKGEIMTQGKQDKLSDKVKRGVALKWGFSQPFSSANSPSPQNGTLISEENPESKSNLQPFLDQSLNNSELGKNSNGTPVGNNDVTAPKIQPLKVNSEDRSQSDNLRSTKSQATSIPFSNETQQTNDTQRREINATKEQISKPSPKRDIIEESSQKRMPSTPRRSKDVLDSVQELPNEAPQSPSSISRQEVKDRSYGAAMKKCQEDRNVDIALAQKSGDAKPLVEYFIQNEEYRTVHEVVEQFVVHNYYLLEYVIKTVYLGERKGVQSVEILSRERMLAEELTI